MKPKRKRAAEPKGKSSKQPVRSTDGIAVVPPRGRLIAFKRLEYSDRIVTSYGPLRPNNPDEEEEFLAACRLERIERLNGVKWFFYGPDTTLLRGEMARLQLQGRWSEGNTALTLARACGRVQRDLRAWQGDDGRTLCAALLDIVATRNFDLLEDLKVAINAGGLVGSDFPPRPYRLSRAVVEAARTLDRPPNGREVFRAFVKAENQSGNRVGDDMPTFYADLKRAGWAWLLGLD